MEKEVSRLSAGFAFQTEGSIWAELEKKTQRMGMEDAIREYLEEHPERKVKKLPSNR